MDDAKNRLEAEALELGKLATKELLSIPGMAEELMEGINTPLSECIPEGEVGW